MSDLSNWLIVSLAAGAGFCLALEALMWLWKKLPPGLRRGGAAVALAGLVAALILMAVVTIVLLWLGSIAFAFQADASPLFDPTALPQPGQPVPSGCVYLSLYSAGPYQYCSLYYADGPFRVAHVTAIAGRIRSVSAQFRGPYAFVRAAFGPPVRWRVGTRRTVRLWPGDFPLVRQGSGYATAFWPGASASVATFGPLTGRSPVLSLTLTERLNS